MAAHNPVGYEAALTALKKLTKVRAAETDIQEYVKHLKNESDRGAMILAATLVDDALLTILSRLTKHANSTERNKIFGPDGPLGSFSKRIQLAQALGLISRENVKHFTIVREIRNAAAHAHVTITFDMPEIKTALGTMLKPEQAEDVQTWPRKNVRNFFLQLCGISADEVMGSQNVSDPDSILGLFRTIGACDLDQDGPFAVHIAE